MNLPNKLTLSRVILVPVFVVLLMCPFVPFGNLWALLVFAVASVTDLLDGKIARKYNLVTNFGKFMDPLADKLLVCSALICLISAGSVSIHVPTWIVLIIIGREFIISGFRLVASDNGLVIAANMWGKVKTAVTMVMICFVVADLGNLFGISSFANIYYWFCQVLIYASLLLTVISLVVYLYDNRSVIKDM